MSISNGTKKGHLTLKIFLLIVATDILESSSQIFFKKGVLLFPTLHLNNIAEFILFLKCIIFSPMIWMGFIVMTINFFLWMLVLNKIDLSVAFPVGSTSFLFVPLLAVILLHENIGILRWAGVLLIIVGIILISKSSYD